MDPERARIQADLSGLIEGEVHCDATFLQMYASDASIYEIPPLGVVRPASTAAVLMNLYYQCVLSTNNLLILKNVIKI